MIMVECKCGCPTYCHLIKSGCACCECTEFQKPEWEIYNFRRKKK